IDLAVMPPAIFVDDLAPSEETVWAFDNRGQVGREPIVRAGRSRKEIENAPRPCIPLGRAVDARRPMHPLERIDSRILGPAEMEPGRVGLLLPPLELEEVAELTGKEPHVERPPAGVDGLGKLLPEFGERRRDGAISAVDRNDRAGAQTE